MRSGTLAFPAIDRIVFGQPAASALAAESERLGASRVFVMASGTMSRTTDEIEKLRAALGTRFAALYDRMPSHTPRGAVLEAAAEARAAGADLIVTFGGGSVTDAGKLLQLCLRHGIADHDAFDAFRTVVGADGRKNAPQFDGPLVRQIAIPTTLSGAEFHAQGGCRDERRNTKHSYRHPLLVPRVTLLDPVSTRHTPLWVWLSTGIRAVDHAVEGLCSQFTNPVSDAAFLQALRLLATALPRVKAAPDDFDARLDCQLAVWLAMAGRQGGVQMGASHAIGHALGGTCGIPHGYLSCLLLPHVLRFNAPVNADRQGIVSETMGRPGVPAADVVADLVRELGLPSTMREAGVGRERYAEIAEHALHEDWLYTNPRRIAGVDDVLAILEAAA